jgi:hypothetical protein
MTERRGPPEETSGGLLASEGRSALLDGKAHRVGPFCMRLRNTWSLESMNTGRTACAGTEESGGSVVAHIHRHRGKRRKELSALASSPVMHHPTACLPRASLLRSAERQTAEPLTRSRKMRDI